MMKVSFATLPKYWANKLPIRSCPISLALNFRCWKPKQRSRKIQWLLLSLYSPSHMFMVFSDHANWYSRGFCALCQERILILLWVGTWFWLQLKDVVRFIYCQSGPFFNRTQTFCEASTRKWVFLDQNKIVENCKPTPPSRDSTFSLSEKLLLMMDQGRGRRLVIQSLVQLLIFFFTTPILFVPRGT